MTTKIINLFDEPIDSASLQQAMTRLQRKSNVVSIQSETDPYVKSRIRKPMMRCHSFRKMFNGACIENNVNHYVKEMLMGHKKNLGLDVNYFRPQQNQLLQEYLKVIDSLTINDENRLSKQVQELVEKDDYNKYIIDKKMQEKDEQINVLSTQLKDIAKQIQEINQRTKLDPNTIKRLSSEEKFELFLKDRERKKQQQQELEQHLQQYNTQKQ